MIESIEEQRALQLALELSLLGLNPDQNNISNSDHSNNIVNTHPNFNGFTNGTTGALMMGLSSEMPGAAPCAPQPKKSQNTTECVPVPSSEHVAEIVGRQGKTIGHDASNDLESSTFCCSKHAFYPRFFLMNFIMLSAVALTKRKTSFHVSFLTL